jgi:predicted permease
VTPDYFRTVGIRLAAGRMLTERDKEDPNVILVNEALAKSYFQGVDPVGKRMKFGHPTDSDPLKTIVGVVADAKQDGMDRPVNPEVYVLMNQSPQNPLTFVVRSKLDAQTVLRAARTQVQSVDKDIVPTDVATLADVVQDSIGSERFRTTLLGSFAAVALFLAALGVYGMLAYFVSQRSRELGIRLALGAKPGTLFRMVVAQAMRPMIIGMTTGLLVAVAVTGALRSLLFGVTPLDPVTYGAAAAVLAVTAFVACALPAARATQVDPLVALREE